MTINIGIARGGPDDGRILVHIGEEKPGFELREAGRYIFDRATTNWVWKGIEMAGMKDQLGDTPFAYPGAPGFKEPTTSRDAARAVRGKAAVLRDRVHGAFVAAGAGGLTADEAAGVVGESVLAVRPRVTELAKETPPRIVATDERRANESGLKAKVWRAA